MTPDDLRTPLTFGEIIRAIGFVVVCVFIGGLAWTAMLAFWFVLLPRVF